jgi:enoyl-CoA hydratase
MLLTGDTFDGITRHTPEGRWFREFAERDGFPEAVAYRDSGQDIPDGGGPLPDSTDSRRSS